MKFFTLVLFLLAPVSLFSQNKTVLLTLKNGESVTGVGVLTTNTDDNLVIKTMDRTYRLTELVDFTVDGQFYTIIMLERRDVPKNAVVLSKSTDMLESVICASVVGRIELFSFVNSRGELISGYPFMNIEKTGLQPSNKGKINKYVLSKGFYSMQENPFNHVGGEGSLFPVVVALATVAVLGKAYSDGKSADNSGGGFWSAFGTTATFGAGVVAVPFVLRAISGPSNAKSGSFDDKYAGLVRDLNRRFPK